MFKLYNSTEITVDSINPELENKLNLQRKLAILNSKYKKRLNPAHQSFKTVVKNEYDIENSNRTIETSSINPDFNYSSMLNKITEFQKISNYHDKRFGLKLAKPKKNKNLDEKFLAKEDLKLETQRIIERIIEKKKIDQTLSMTKTLPQFFTFYSTEKFRPYETDLHPEIKNNNKNALEGNLRNTSNITNSKLKNRMHQELLYVKRNLKFDLKSEIKIEKPLLKVDRKINSSEKLKIVNTSSNVKNPKGFQYYIPKSFSKTMNTAKESVKKILRITKSLSKAPNYSEFLESPIKDYNDSYDKNIFSPVPLKNQSSIDESPIDIRILSAISGIRQQSSLISNKRPIILERNLTNLEPSESRITIKTSRRPKFIDKKIPMNSFRSEERNLILKPNDQSHISHIRPLFDDFLKSFCITKKKKKKKKNFKNNTESIKYDDLKQTICDSFRENYKMERIDTNNNDCESNIDMLSSRETNFIVEK